MAKKDSLTFYITRPGKYGRASFSVCKRVGNKVTTLKLPEVEGINKQYKAGTLDFDRAEMAVTEIKDRLLRKHRKVYNANPDNMKLLQQYWG